MELTELTGREFVTRLASSAPTPGGGGAAALVGAVGTALGEMVASLTVGKKKYAAVEGRVLELQTQAEKLRLRLLELVQEDAEGFAPLAEAYGLPKDTEEQRREKERIMEDALQKACMAPMEMMDRCCQALEIIKELGEIGSRLAVSDAGCAAACCRAAIEAAALNVAINTRTMTDRERACELDRVTDMRLKTGRAQADHIYSMVWNRLKD